MEVINFLETLTFLSGIFLVLFLINIKFKISKVVNDFFRVHSLKFVFIISLTATLGSLFFSEILGFVPCKLCWIQRIFMYPLTIITGVALYRKDYNIKYYVLPLASIGMLFSIYQYIGQVFPSGLESVFCAIGEASCQTVYTFAYGYITIPMMALTAFLLIITLVLILPFYYKK